MSMEDLMKDEHFKLLTFLIVSARGCVDEPHLYGPLRLIDAASKLIDIMSREGKAVKELIEVKELIDKNKHLVMYDESEFVRFLDDLVLRIAKLIKSA